MKIDLKTIFFNALLLVLSLFFITLLSEIVCIRLFSRSDSLFSHPHLTFPRIYRQSAIEGLSYELIPAAGMTAYGAPVRINSQGFRNNYRVSEPDTATIRIVILGDSSTFGLGVREQDCYVKIAEKVINDIGIAAEIINTGVVGYNTHQEWVMLKDCIADLQPDLIIVGFDTNDNQPTMRLIEQEGMSYFSFGSATNEIPNLRLRYYIGNISYLSQVVHFRWRKLSYRWSNWLISPAGAEAINPYSSVLNTYEKMICLSVEHGCKFGVVAITDDMYHGAESMFQALNEDGIPVGYLVKRQDYRHLGWDGHPNETTHRLMGERLVEFIQNNFLNADE